ncbi:MAG TPA: CaiB/BaiF CoA-transferase family protein [Polyangiaceae bacterium]|nr:CaiB/BaiF CoA-transferase family protein [Polyangiaceae bacterium]
MIAFAMSALQGIKVLDLTRLLPGPIGSLVLADLGAQVDKIEDAGNGDYLRVSAAPVAGMSASFHALNRGKRSLVLDLKKAEGAQVLLRLVEQYDVLFEQFRPGVLDRLGVGHSTLLERNPQLVVCALTGYGQTGPLQKRAGHDLNYMARAGLLGLQGPSSGPPQIPAFQLADVSGGLWSVIAILAALRERDRTGRGAVLDIAMLESVIPFATIGLSRLFGGEPTPERGRDSLSGGLAVYEAYATSDGEAVTFGALEPKFMMAFCQGVGFDADMSLLYPGAHQEELKRKFSQIFASKTRAEWQAFNERHDCCIEPVLRPEELYGDEQLAARRVFAEYDTGEGRVGQFRTPVTPLYWQPGPAPKAGEHSRQILDEAGFEAEEITALETAGVIR